jgi:hypothetical protein
VSQILEAIEAVEAVEAVKDQQCNHQEYPDRTALLNFYLEKARLRYEVVKARRRIPEDLRGTSPYSAMTLWAFIVHADHDTPGKTCAYCQMFDGQTFRGDQLRTTFPDHYWKGIDIYPDVHMTLWGKPGTCGCMLIREPDGNELNLETWSSLDDDWMDNPGESRLIYTRNIRLQNSLEL